MQPDVMQSGVYTDRPSGSDVLRLGARCRCRFCRRADPRFRYCSDTMGIGGRSSSRLLEKPRQKLGAGSWELGRQRTFFNIVLAPFCGKRLHG